MKLSSLGSNYYILENNGSIVLLYNSTFANTISLPKEHFHAISGHPRVMLFYIQEYFAFKKHLFILMFAIKLLLNLFLTKVKDKFQIFG